jgi:hypothetical protein
MLSWRAGEYANAVLESEITHTVYALPGSIVIHTFCPGEQDNTYILSGREG